MADWLTRAQIQDVVENLSADDLIRATTTGQGAEIAGIAFNSAAARMGTEDATSKVKAADFQYLAEQIGGAINVESPLSEDTESLLNSADTGE